jgi:hypothetical protein
MKAITMILLTIFMAKGCSQEAKNDLENTKIQYIANTRGFYKKITIQNQEVSISQNRNDEGNGETTKISDTDWKKLVSTFETVQLESLSTYKDPTQKRFYDGAAMANMTITYKEKEYQTTTFDHGTPPVEIADFVNKVVSLVKDEE